MIYTLKIFHKTVTSRKIMFKIEKSKINGFTLQNSNPIHSGIITAIHKSLMENKLFYKAFSIFLWDT